LEKLIMRFGEDTMNGIMEDGKIDRQKLHELIKDSAGMKIGHHRHGHHLEETDPTETPPVTETTGTETSPPNPLAEQTVQNIADKISSGELSKDEFVQRLQERFGEAANGIVNEEGAIDFSALLKLIESNSLNATA